VEFPAVVFSGPGEAEVRDVEVPDPGPGEVLVRSEYSQISTGTERCVWQGDFHEAGQPPLPYPVVPGYQRVGIVEELGEDVEGLQPGMRVFATRSRFEGVASCWGSHCQYGLTPARECMAVPAWVPPVAVSGLVLTQVGYVAGSLPAVEESSVAVVVGSGLVGQWCAQRLYGRGARVIVAGRHELRLDRAELHARARGVNVTREDLAAVVEEMRPGGADIVVATVATRAAVAQAAPLLREGGQLVLNEFCRDGCDLEGVADLKGREVRYFSPAAWTREGLEATLGLVAERKMEVEDLVTHKIPWPYAAGVYRKLVWDKAEEFMAVVIDWTVG
jgi:2-desacetyl-2-hydroxyethyl bacteriochlorophyllide A dehydrogenase